MIGNGRNESSGVNGRQRFHASGNQVGALLELGFERGIILAQKPIHRSNQTNNFLFRHFQPAADGVGVRRIVQLGGFDQILASQEQA